MRAARGRWELAWWIGVVLTALAAYVGGYYWAVANFEGDPCYSIQWDRREWKSRTWWDTFFTPIHQVDRRLRPNAWLKVMPESKPESW